MPAISEFKEEYRDRARAIALSYVEHQLQEINDALAEEARRDPNRKPPAKPRKRGNPSYRERVEANLAKLRSGDDSATFEHSSYTRTSDGIVVDQLHSVGHKTGMEVAGFGKTRIVFNGGYHAMVVLKSDFEDPGPLLKMLRRSAGGNGVPLEAVVLYNARIEGVHFAKELGAPEACVALSNGDFAAVIKTGGRPVYVTGASSWELDSEALPKISESEFYKSWTAEFSETLRNRLRTKTRMRDSLQAQLLQYSHEVGALGVTLRMIEIGGVDFVQSEVNKMRALSAVESLSIGNSGDVLIVTKPLVSGDLVREAEGRRAKQLLPGRYMGVYEISIGMIKPLIRYRNLRPPTPKATHPHGNCLSGFQPYLLSAYSLCKYEAVVSTVVEFLRSITPEDAVGYERYVQQWPVSLEPPSRKYVPSDWVKLMEKPVDHVHDDDDDDEADED